MGEAKLNRKLNLVLELDSEKGKISVHSTPISKSVFEDNYLAISRTFTAIYANGLGPMAGPRVAALMLKDEAKKIDAVEKTNSLLAEITRLTNVIAPGENGWETLPFDVAKKRGILDEDNASLAENFIVYFMCASSIHLRGELAVATEVLKTVWGVQHTSLNATEYMRSLPISTPDETIGEKPLMAVNQ
jgi:hypothetical protein